MSERPHCEVTIKVSYWIICRYVTNQIASVSMLFCATGVSGSR